MHRLVLLPALAVGLACQGPSAIQTSATGPMRSEVESEVMDTHQMHHGDCPAAKIVAARIVQQGSGTTQEVWTLAGCGHTYAYDVTITHEGFGGQVSVHEHEDAP